jgi:Ca-activated chloride channel homolog
MRKLLPLLTLLLLPMTVGAQESNSTAQVLPPPAVLVKINGKSEPIRVKSVETRVRIFGPLAETRATLTFYNPHDRNLSGDLYFPLPEGSTVSGYALDINGVLVEGVAVTKEKARQTFEKEVRKGIDPGLIEWTKGNSFKTRIFPLPAKGTRTIQVSYVSEIVETDKGGVYHLPLDFKSSLEAFSLRVEILQSTVKPVVANAMQGFQFGTWQKGFVATATLKNAALTEDLWITLPDTGKQPVYVERGDDGVHRFLIDHDVAATGKTGAVSRPNHVTLLWDASGSRANADHDREFQFLRAYLGGLLEEKPELGLSLVVFRNRAERAESIDLKAGGLETLFRRLSTIRYDGGTQVSSISPAKGARTDLYLLFTDGISTFGESDPGAITLPVYVLNTSTVADASFMKSLARQSGGRYFNLHRTPASKAAAALGRSPHSFLSASAKAADVSETYPQIPQPADGRFLFAGELKADATEVVLNFGAAGKVTGHKAFSVSKANAIEGDLLRRYWAQRKLNHLLVAQKENQDAITWLGRKHGLVTPFTSLIVLETLEQYVEHKILPPKSLKAVRDRYIQIVESQRLAEKETERQKLERIVGLWKQRVAWWKTEFNVPEGFRYGARKQKKSADRERGRRAGAPSNAPMAEESEGEMDGAAMDDEAAGGAEPRASAESKNASGTKGDAGGSDAKIVVAKWDPKTPYLEALKAAAQDKRFDVYMEQRKTYGTSPAFFLDCADFFLNAENERIGIQVLSNIAEMELESAPLLRILASRLKQLNKLDLSVLVFEEVLAMRAEEPQSWRDLGLVLALRGTTADYARSIELLYHVVLNTWDRFSEIELLTLMELNTIIPKAKAAGVTQIPVDGRLIEALSVDIRIVMTWDADLTDMDLHVLEPSGEEAFYSHNRTTIGGLVSRDFTQGYGPEEYLVKTAMPGTYEIKTKFFGSRAAELIGAVTLHVDIYTHYGTPNEKKQSLTLRLTENKETFVVGKITFK